jgi:uncharacterized protein (TIGR03790 family)
MVLILIFLNAALALTIAAAPASEAPGPQHVAVLVNENSTLSRRIGEYYARQRGIPREQVILLRSTESETIDRARFEADILLPLRERLRAAPFTKRLRYLVVAQGLPLRISSNVGGTTSDAASVDSELTMLPSSLMGKVWRLPGNLANPFYGVRGGDFSPQRFGIFLVNRLAGWSFADVKAMIDHGMQARNQGIFVLDGKGAWRDPGGDQWLKELAAKLPTARVRMDNTPAMLQQQSGVIFWASWGSNDPARKTRTLGFRYLPGAVVTEYVSTNGRSFVAPAAGWQTGSWSNPFSFYAGSPQSLSADYIAEGASGVTGHVYEPYLEFCPRPQIMGEAYFGGRTWAEAAWMSIPSLSWMNVVIGDPLMRLNP